MSKITAYSALSSPAAGDLLPVVDVSDTTMAASGTTKKVAVSDLLAARVVSGQYLRVPSVYSPPAQVLLVVSSTTMAAFNAAPTTVASGSNGGEISTIASWSAPSAGVLSVASTAGYPASGTLNVAASGPTTAVVTYTGTTGTTFTGCAYVSGSATGTVATGGAVTLTSVALTTGSFTAPPSGDVLVTAYCTLQIGTSADKVAFGLAAAGTITPLVCPVNTATIASAGGVEPRAVTFWVTGLTPGTSYNFALLGCVTSGITATIYAYGQTSTSLGSGGSPMIMTVQAV